MLNGVYIIWYSMTNEHGNICAEMTMSFYIIVQVVGTDVDDVHEHLTDIQHYCQATCGQHIHDILDRIDVALAVSCMPYIFKFILSMFYGDLVTLTVLWHPVNWRIIFITVIIQGLIRCHDH